MVVKTTEKMERQTSVAYSHKEFGEKRSQAYLLPPRKYVQYENPETRREIT